MNKYDIGSYRDRAEVLECRQKGRDFAWEPIGRIWVRRERTGLYRLFSRVGLSAEGWDFHLRARPLSLHQALRVNGSHYFLCDIGKPDQGYMTVEAARVQVVTATGEAGRPEESFQFPACFTELYVRHDQREPMSVNVIDFVFVTPKIVHLAPGSLVDCGRHRYEVLTAHTLDEYKNEYTVRKVVDL